MSIKLMARAWEKQYEKRSHREVLLVLCDHANDDGICWPSRDLVAWKTDLSKETLKGVYSRLRELEVIEVIGNADGGRGVVPILRVDLEKLPDKPPRERGEPITPLRVEKGGSGSLKGGSGSTKGGNSLPPEPSEPPEEPSSSAGSANANRAPRRKGKAKPYCTQLVDLCRGVDFDPTDDQVKWWGAAINREVTSGTSEERIAKIMGVIEDQAANNFYCSWKQAKKILDGEVKPHDKHESNIKDAGTPARQVAKLEAHEELKRYAEIARRYDFTSDLEPPFSVMSRLGGDDDERYRILTRIRSVVGANKTKAKRDAPYPLQWYLGAYESATLGDINGLIAAELGHEEICERLEERERNGAA